MSLAGVDWKAMERLGGIPKPESRKKEKGRKDRDEASIKKAVRAACVRRDGYCLAKNNGALKCAGKSEWAHLSGHRRRQTRGLPVEIRHNTRWTCMLCVRHHNQEERGQFKVVYLSTEYADGPVKWEAA